MLRRPIPGEGKGVSTGSSKQGHEWRRYPLTSKDVDVFLALIIAMGICGFPTLRYTPVKM